MTLCESNTALNISHTGSSVKFRDEYIKIIAGFSAFPDL